MELHDIEIYGFNGGDKNENNDEEDLEEEVEDVDCDEMHWICLLHDFLVIQSDFCYAVALG